MEKYKLSKISKLSTLTKYEFLFLGTILNIILTSDGMFDNRIIMGWCTNSAGGLHELYSHYDNVPYDDNFTRLLMNIQ